MKSIERRETVDWKQSNLLDCIQWWTPEGAAAMSQSPHAEKAFTFWTCVPAEGKSRQHSWLGAHRSLDIPPKKGQGAEKVWGFTTEQAASNVLHALEHKGERSHINIILLKTVANGEEREREREKRLHCNPPPTPPHGWICSMVLAAGGNYHAVSELPPHQCATSFGRRAKLHY